MMGTGRRLHTSVVTPAVLVCLVSSGAAVIAVTKGQAQAGSAKAGPAKAGNAPTVLFMCPHGAAKSVLASAYFQRLAKERGLNVRVESAGTEPDAQVAPAVASHLTRNGYGSPSKNLGGLRPRISPWRTSSSRWAAT